MSSLVRIETLRLVGERVQPADLADLRALHSDPLVARTLSKAGEPWPEYRIIEAHQQWMDHWERYGFGTWFFRGRDDGAFVGRCGLRWSTVTGPERVELFYAVLSEHWDRGYATEMSHTLLDLAFGRLGLDEVVCFALPTNGASRRVIDKLGFHYQGDVMHAGVRHNHFRVGPEDRRPADVPVSS